MVFIDYEYQPLLAFAITVPSQKQRVDESLFFLIKNNHYSLKMHFIL